MPQIYKILTAVLAFTGCGGLVMTGELNPLMLISGIGLIPGYIRFWKDMPNLSRWTIGGLSIATLFLFVIDTLVITGDMFIAVAHLTIVFQAIKSFDLKEPWGPSAGVFYVLTAVDYCLRAYKVRGLWAHICYLPCRACYSNGYITFSERGHCKKIRLRGL